MTLVLALLCAVLGVLAAGLAVWATAERGRAARAILRADLLERQAGESLEALKGQASITASAVAETLLQRSAEAAEAQHKLSQARLEAQLKPVADSLKTFEEKVGAIEKARAEESGGLKEQLRQLMAASTATQDEARKLAQALGRGVGVQGRWGEQMLKLVLERAGLRAGHDFEEQAHLVADGAAFRPDASVNLPGGGVLVIDAKCSLTAFDEVQKATEDAERLAALKRHVASLKTHVDGLSRKAYWEKASRSPDFVAMFVPGDGLVAAALDIEPDLLAFAMDKRVVIVTPTTLFGLCKVVALGWRAERQAENAREVAALGRELHGRIATMGQHVAGVGRSLGQAVAKYNQFVGSLESQVLVQARRFEDLGVDHTGKSIEEAPAIEAAPRELSKLAPAGPPALTLVEAAPTSAQ
ncbi:MAG: DNA recombination protein RmuC [Caulobacteraceae bacterium]|nr:DNA recombination protein RmuC [Caulobacteraceae bacterium]